MTYRLKAAAAVAAVSLTTAATALAAAPAGHGGEIRMFSNFSSKVSTPVVVAGAIGDFGHLVSTDRNGHPDADGSFLVAKLSRGTIDLDGRQVLKAIHPEGAPNMTTCSVTIGGSGPMPITGGTGAYQGIHGTLRATGQAAVVALRNHQGKCAEGGRPAAMLGGVEVSGNVTF
jgi:hypothetical protein